MSEVQSIEKIENIMRKIKIGKVVLNIGVGRSGEVLERAKKILHDLTGHKPCTRKAKRSVRDFGIHKGESIATLVTLRGNEAVEILKRLIIAREMRLSSSSFDRRGNCSFGIKEHIEIPGIKYDPEIGIFGLNINITLERSGYNVSKRRRTRSKVGKGHIITQEESIKFFKELLGVDIY